MQQIVLFTDEQMPEGSAGATRVISFGHLFELLGYSVRILGVNYNKAPQTIGEYEGMHYELLDFPEITFKGSKRHIRRNALKRELLKWLSDHCTAQNTKAIYLFGLESELTWLLGYPAIAGIPLIKDVVEWFDISKFKGLGGVPNYIEDRLALIVWNIQCKNIIGISSLLTDYYQKRKCQCVRIPTILDTNTYEAADRRNGEKKLTLAYAGSPARKDYVTNMVRAVALLPENERKEVSMHFYGVSENDIRSLGLGDDELVRVKDSVYFHGRIPYREVRSNIQKADFTVLLRPNKRYANAGFPTKVGESMAAGVPVMANITSDIGLYLHDGAEGIVCDNETPEALSRSIRRALKLTENEKQAMRASARKQAERSFDYRQYAEPMKQFLAGLK